MYINQLIENIFKDLREHTIFKSPRQIIIFFEHQIKINIIFFLL